MIKDMRFLSKAVMKQQGHNRELFTLLMNNPDLPVICWVDSDIIPDYEYGRYQGSFGDCHIIEYIDVEMYRDYREFVYKDDTEEYEAFLAETTDMTDEEIAEFINNIQWTKAIAVNIDLPD